MASARRSASPPGSAIDAQQPASARALPSTLVERPALIVEDSPTSRELLETLLKSWSVPVIAVASAEEGLALLEGQNRQDSPDPFGLVILDWMLPGMNGLEAAGRIRSRSETRTLPIIIISAYAGKEEEARCSELGVNVFLRKPVTASSLFDAVVESQGAGVYATRRGLDGAARARVRWRGGASGRGQRGQSDGRDRASRPARNRARHRSQRPRSDRDGSGGADEVRSDPDGHADAGARRPRRDACAPCRSALHDRADHRDDRERDEGRPRRLSCRRHERSRHQTDRPTAARRHAAALAACTTSRPEPRCRAERCAGGAVCATRISGERPTRG